MVQKAFGTIRRTRLYQTTELEWTQFNEENKTLSEFKMNSIQAYKAVGGNPFNGYHGASNTLEDDDSLGSITESLANIQMVNNTQQQATNDDIAQLTAQNQQMMQALQAMQMQSAHMATPWTPPPAQQQTYQNWQQQTAQAAIQPHVPPQ